MSESRLTAQSPQQRPFIGIFFDCCRVYYRVYRNKQRTAYVGHCPRCMTPIRLAIGPGGTDARFFTAK